MDMRDELNAVLDPAVTAKVAAHYRHARAKHPRFADRLFAEEGTRFFCEASKERLETWRSIVNNSIECTANSLISCEVAEMQEAYARGDKSAAVEECYDVIAVLLRMVDVLEGRQALGDPDGPHGETKTEGAMQ